MVIPPLTASPDWTSEVCAHRIIVGVGGEKIDELQPAAGSGPPPSVAICPLFRVAPTAVKRVAEPDAGGLSRGDHALRLNPMADDGFGVAANAQETPRPPRPEPRKAQHEHAGHACDTAPIHRVAGAVEDRQLDIRPIGREAGRPNDRADAAGDEIERLRLLAAASRRADRRSPEARRFPCPQCADRSAR